MSTRRLLLLLVAPLVLVTAACATRAQDPVTAGRPGDRNGTSATAGDGYTPAPIDWDDCGSVECATLDVPLDYGEPDGALIEIYVVRSAATGDRRGALFVNPGGPGASAAELAESLSSRLPSEITEHFDVVGVDPRGSAGAHRSTAA